MHDALFFFSLLRGRPYRFLGRTDDSRTTCMNASNQEIQFDLDFRGRAMDSTMVQD
jgi:hypothetical protein